MSKPGAYVPWCHRRPFIVLRKMCTPGFGQLDYAGVARVLKLDAGLNEVVVAVKLQEVRRCSNLTMSLLSLFRARRGIRA